MSKFLFTACMAVVLPASLFGQKADDWSVLQEKYAGEPAVFMERSETVSIMVRNDSLKLVADVFEDILYLKDPPEMFASRRVHGSHFTEVQGIKAKTLVWDKSRHKELSVSNFARKFDTDNSIFYDDSYYYSVAFPSVAPRNRTQLQYSNVYRDPRFLPGYIFATYIPQEKAVYMIKTTEDVELHHEVRNDEKGAIKFRKYTKGKDVYYEWTASAMEPTKLEGNAPSVRYYAPHVLVYVKSYRTANGKKNVLSSLDDLYQWYSTWLKDMNKDPASEDLVAIVKGLQVKGDSEQETVRRIFYWVQDNIRYIAFEDGMRGFIPHSGSYVCEKRYGDCKDMASIIIEMLRIAGIKAYPTWIGTRDIPYAYSTLPSPLVDNHMIATYIADTGEMTYLDATSNHTPFGFPSSMIQGKEALIGMGKTYEIGIVPEIHRDRNVTTDSVRISIKETEISGEGFTTLTGYPKVMAGYRLDRVRKDAVERYVAQLVGKGSNKFYLDSYSLNDLNNRDYPTRINYVFRIGDYFQQIGNEIYLNLHLTKDYFNDFINVKTREIPIENEYKYLKKEVVVFEIPEGFVVDYLPGNARIDGNDIGLEVLYRVEKNTIVMEKTFFIDYLLLPADRFEKWNETTKKISDAYREAIILKKQ